MDRQIVYPGQVLPETTLLQMTKDAMIGLAKLSSAMLGTSTIANGFAVTPTTPASLQVLVAPGEIYSLQNIDSTAFSSLAADTTHQIVKQGISLDTVTLSCPAPGTSGQSINYLVEAAYQDADANPVLLPYYNSANPSAPYSGIGNNGLTQNTARQGAVIVQVKAGVSATTGSQTTPAPDSGFVGLYVVTVAYGQTQVVAGNISQFSGAPLLPTGLLPAVQSGAATYGADSGAVNAYVVNYTPAIATLSDTMELRFKAANANTGASTLKVNGLPAKSLVTLGQAALIGGEILGNSRCRVMYNSTLDAFVLLSADGGSLTSGRLIGVQIFSTVGTATYTKTPGTKSVVVEAVGGGGAGGSAATTSASQIASAGGGGSGAYGKGRYTSGFDGVTVTVGAGGAASAAGTNAGNPGGTSSFGALLSCPGGTAGGGGSAISSAGISGSSGGPGSAPLGANINGVAGVGGDNGFGISTTQGFGGRGASNPLGSGGHPPASSGVRIAGTGYGSGSSGANNGPSSAAVAGIAGQQGIVIVWEFA